MFDPGNMNTPADFFQPPARQLTAMGAEVDGAATLAFSRLVMLMYLRGQERLEAQRPDAEVDARIVVWLDDETRAVNPSWHIKAVEKTFGVQYILSVPGGTRAQRLEIYCKAEA